MSAPSTNDHSKNAKEKEAHAVPQSEISSTAKKQQTTMIQHNRCQHCGESLYIFQQEQDDKDPWKDELTDFELKKYRKAIKSIRKKFAEPLTYEKLFGKPPPGDRGRDTQHWDVESDYWFEEELEELKMANSRVFTRLNDLLDEVVIRRDRDPTAHHAVKKVKKQRNTYRLKANTCSAFFDIVKSSDEKKLFFAKLKIRRDAYERVIKSINYCANCGTAIAQNEVQT